MIDPDDYDMYRMMQDDPEAYEQMMERLRKEHEETQDRLAQFFDAKRKDAKESQDD